MIEQIEELQMSGTFRTRVRIWGSMSANKGRALACMGQLQCGRSIVRES